MFFLLANVFENLFENFFLKNYVQVIKMVAPTLSWNEMLI